jgi:hypothetical protein
MKVKDFINNKYFLCKECNMLATVRLEFGYPTSRTVFLCEEHLHRLRELVVDMEIKHGY